MEYDYTSHKADLLSDYVFFGKNFRWQPSEIDNMGWSARKEIKQAYVDHHLQNS